MCGAHLSSRFGARAVIAVAVLACAGALCLAMIRRSLRLDDERERELDGWAEAASPS